MPKLSQSKLGFTLIELLVVIAIIGTLSSIAVINLRGSTRKASYTAAMKTVASLIPLIDFCIIDNRELCPDCTSDYGDPDMIPLPATNAHVCAGDNNLWPPLPDNWQYEIMTVNLLPNYVEFRLGSTQFPDDAIQCEFGERIKKSRCKDY